MPQHPINLFSLAEGIRQLLSGLSSETPQPLNAHNGRPKAMNLAVRHILSFKHRHQFYHRKENSLPIFPLSDYVFTRSRHEYEPAGA
jgi:hypothetical protein